MAPNTHYNSLRQILNLIVLDLEEHKEHRFYEPWDLVLNHIRRRTNQQGKDISIAPQYTFERDIYNRCPDRSEMVDPDASTEVQPSETSFSSDTSSLVTDPLDLSIEARIPDFTVFRVSPQRRVLFFLELKPIKDAIAKQMRKSWLQFASQAQFIFEQTNEKNRQELYGMLIVGTSFLLHRFKREALPALPEHALGNPEEDDYDPDQKKRVRAPGVIKPAKLLDVNGLYTTQFKDAINTILKADGFPEIIEW